MKDPERITYKKKENLQTQIDAWKVFDFNSCEAVSIEALPKNILNYLAWDDISRTKWAKKHFNPDGTTTYFLEPEIEPDRDHAGNIIAQHHRVYCIDFVGDDNAGYTQIYFDTRGDGKIIQISTGIRMTKTTHPDDHDTPGARNYRGKGFGARRMWYMNHFLQSQYGAVLYSDKSTSVPARRLWEDFVNAGYAIDRRPDEDARDNELRKELGSSTTGLDDSGKTARDKRYRFKSKEELMS